MTFEIPQNSPVHCIITFDGGSDHLLPGRWIAQLRGWDDMEYGRTENDAVDNLKATLREKYPNVLWYQSLPVVQSTPVIR
jgi:hypothetical protein